MDSNMAISFLSVDCIWSQPDTTSQSDEFKYVLLFSEGKKMEIDSRVLNCWDSYAHFMYIWNVIQVAANID